MSREPAPSQTALHESNPVMAYTDSMWWIGFKNLSFRVLMCGFKILEARMTHPSFLLITGQQVCSGHGQTHRRDCVTKESLPLRTRIDPNTRILMSSATFSFKYKSRLDGKPTHWTLGGLMIRASFQPSLTGPPSLRVGLTSRSSWNFNGAWSRFDSFFRAILGYAVVMVTD